MDEYEKWARERAQEVTDMIMANCGMDAADRPIVESVVLDFLDAADTGKLRLPTDPFGPLPLEVFWTRFRTRAEHTRLESAEEQ